MIKQKIEHEIAQKLATDISLEVTAYEGVDFCISQNSLNKLSQLTGKDSQSIIREISELFADSRLAHVEYDRGFLNFYITSMKEEVLDYLTNPNYLVSDDFLSKKVLIDYSGPNIAKRFSIGNLRSTIIGDAVFKSYKALGAETLGINHLGDWGTQFGKLIVAIKRWGSLEEININPIEKLSELYVKFHKEAEKNLELEDEARATFKNLEEGREEEVELWRKCISWSVQEFNKYYDLLNIEIDITKGESEYIPYIDSVLEELKSKNFLTISQGAEVVEFDDLPPAIIRKSDEATLYMTRDLAAIKWRIENLGVEKIIYHVGMDQQLHFQQLFRICKMLGWDQKAELIFAGHGMVSLPEGKMSTRSGNVVILEDLVEQAREKVRSILAEKDSSTDEDKVKNIAIGAIKYSDLKQNRKTNIIFNWEKALDLNGNSSPYLQYSYARLVSIINKSGIKEEQIIEYLKNTSDVDGEIYKVLLPFQSILKQTAQTAMPNILSAYVYGIASNANSYYEKVHVIQEDQNEVLKNIAPIFLFKKIISDCLNIIGIETLDRI